MIHQFRIHFVYNVIQQKMELIETFIHLSNLRRVLQYSSCCLSKMVQPCISSQCLSKRFDGFQLQLNLIYNSLFCPKTFERSKQMNRGPNIKLKNTVMHTFLALNPEGESSRAFESQISKLFANVRINCVSAFGIGLNTFKKL